jgi:hypothetical protein
MPGPSRVEPPGDLVRCSAVARAQSAATRAYTQEVLQRTGQLLAEAHDILQVTSDAWRQRRFSPSGREVLRRSEYLRLVARLETMPVIEQAKGIIMAQSNCGEADAFDLLRRASQRSNVPVRDLAARIVGQAAATVTPAAGPERQSQTFRHPDTRRPRSG